MNDNESIANDKRFLQKKSPPAYLTGICSQKNYYLVAFRFKPISTSLAITQFSGLPSVL